MVSAQSQKPANMPVPRHTPHSSLSPPLQSLHLPAGIPTPPHTPQTSVISLLQLHLPAGIPLPPHIPHTSRPGPLQTLHTSNWLH